MKAFLLPIAACAVLSGCATYGDPYGYGYGYGYPSVSGSVHYSNTPNYGYGAYGYDGRQYRDRDGDGVPNRMDARPNNPRRY
jgi:hypothetical protein